MNSHSLHTIEFAEMVQAVYSNNEEYQLDATKKFRQCSSKPRLALINEIVDTGIVPRLVEFLQKEENSVLQLEAVRTLENILASGTSEHTTIVVDTGAVPIFISLLNSDSKDIRYHVLKALSFIADNCFFEYRNVVLNHGIVVTLLRLLQPMENSFAIKVMLKLLGGLCKAVCVFRNLSEQINLAPDFEIISSCLPVLSRLLLHDDWSVTQFSCWTICYLSHGPDKIQSVIESGACEALVQLLSHPSENVQCAAVRTVGNIATGNNDQTQVIINHLALPRLSTLLNSPNRLIRKYSCWIISNITAGNQIQIDAVIDANIFPKLMYFIENSDFKTKKEVAWAITNAISSGTADQISYLVGLNCIYHMCQLLSSMDSELIHVALLGIKNILRQGDQEAIFNDGVNAYAAVIKACLGVEKIEFLQTSDHNELAQRIINQYFQLKDDETDFYNLMEMLSI